MIRKLFGFDGRINRATMWIYYLASCFAAPLSFLPDLLSGDMGKGTEFVPMPTTPAMLAFRILQCAWVLGVFWIMLAAVIKRLHDRGRSAAWLFLFFGVPAAFIASGFYGAGHSQLAYWRIHFVLAPIVMAFNIWYFAELLFLPGSSGANKYGADPRERAVQSGASA